MTFLAIFLTLTPAEEDVDNICMSIGLRHELAAEKNYCPFKE